MDARRWGIGASADFAIRLPARVRHWWSENCFPSRPDGHVEQPFVSPALGALLLVLIASPVLFLNLSYPFAEPDENREAQIALEMFQSGDYIVPTRNGEPYLQKPPLLFWTICAAYRALGVHEWSARLPVALAALATVLATYLLGRRAVGARAAWIGALMLLLSGGFVLVGRFVVMDAMLTLCTTTGLLAAHAGATAQRRRAAWWLAAGVACGLGILVKGPVALVLVVPPLVAARWLSPKDFHIRWWEGLLLMAVALALAAPWYLLVAERQGEFWAEFLWKQNIERYTHAFDHHEPWWFYVPTLFLGMLPASALFPSLAIFLFSRRNELRRLRTPGLGLMLLAAAWVVLFFSLSSSKLPTYILPAIPPICLMLGRLVDRVLLPVAGAPDLTWQPYLQWERVGLVRRVGIVFGLLGVACGVADVALDRDGLWGNIACGLIVVASIGMFAAAVTSRLPGGSLGWSLAGGMALMLLSFGFNDLYAEGVARRSCLRRAPGAVAAARAKSRKLGVPLAMYATLCEGSSLYFDDRGLAKVGKDQPEKLVELAGRHPRLLVLATHNDARILADYLPYLSPACALHPLEGEPFLYELAAQDRSPQPASVGHGSMVSR